MDKTMCCTWGTFSSYRHLPTMYPFLQLLKQSKTIAFVVVYLSFLLDNVLLTVVGKRELHLVAICSIFVFSSNNPRLLIFEWCQRFEFWSSYWSCFSESSSAQIWSFGERQRAIRSSVSIKGFRAVSFHSNCRLPYWIFRMQCTPPFGFLLHALGINM